jgi:hypothetical protein
MNWKRWRPRALVVEAGWHPEHWESLLVEAGYVRGLNDGLNYFFLREEDRALLSRLQFPANVADGYTPYHVHRRLAQSEEWERMGPAIRAVARRLNDLKTNNPRLAGLAKAIVHWGAGQLRTSRGGRP